MINQASIKELYTPLSGAYKGTLYAPDNKCLLCAGIQSDWCIDKVYMYRPQDCLNGSITSKLISSYQKWKYIEVVT